MMHNSHRPAFAMPLHTKQTITGSVPVILILVLVPSALNDENSPSGTVLLHPYLGSHNCLCFEYVIDLKICHVKGICFT